MTVSIRRHSPLPPIAHLNLLTPPHSSTLQNLPPLRHPSPQRRLMDWLDMSRQHSAAEKTCEMICYLWFSTRSPSSPSRRASTLQLVASPLFVNFMRKVLETTQVSESVIVLSLHYIYRLKDRNWCTSAQPGSEFRIAVAALMMANKFLDDNTYTNKTWSEVSGISLAEINRMEREFLLGIDFALFVGKQTYDSWLNLLKGLVMAKERDSQWWRGARPHAPSRTLPRPPRPSVRQVYHRARSSSPTPAPAYAPAPLVSPPSPEYSPAPVRPGTKRSAAAAFSPSMSAYLPPLKRPPVTLALEIPPPRSGPPSGSGDDAIKGFARMSIGEEEGGKTLGKAWRFDERKVADVPQNLYFYSLACSPSEPCADDRDRMHKAKARLRYHQPPPPSIYPYSSSNSNSNSYACLAPLPPLHVQSARSSPHLNLGIGVGVGVRPPPKLRVIESDRVGNGVVERAPFANAGPAGVRFWGMPMPMNFPVSMSNFPASRDVWVR